MKKEILGYSCLTIGILAETYFMIALKLGLEKGLETQSFFIGLLPNQIYYYLGIFLIALPIFFLKKNEIIKTVSLTALSFFILGSYLLYSPYGYIYGKDGMYAFQVSETIRETGYWSPGTGTSQALIYSLYPAMHIYNLAFSQITGIELANSFLFSFNFISFLVFPMIIFLILKLVSKNINLAYIGTALVLISPFTPIHPQHQNFAILFFLAIFYLILKIYVTKNFNLFFLIIPFSFFVIIAHHFIAYLLIILLIYTLVYLKFFKKRDKQEEVFRRWLILVLIILVFFSFWNINISMLDNSDKVKDLSKTFSAIISPLIKEQTYSEKLFNDLNLTEQEANFSMGLEQDNFKQVYSNIINPNYRKINPTAGTSYNLTDKLVIFLNAGIQGLLLILGIIIILKFQREERNYFYLGLLFIFTFVILIFSLLIFTSYYYIIGRILSFAYVLFVIPISQFIIKISDKKMRWIIGIIVLFAVIGGSLSAQSAGSIRFYYIDREVLMTESSIFNSWQVISASNWHKSNMEGTIMGDELINNCFNALKAIPICCKKETLHLLDNGEINKLDQKTILWGNVKSIGVHDYLISFPSHLKFKKFEKTELDQLDKINYLIKDYNNGLVYIYGVDL